MEDVALYKKHNQYYKEIQHLSIVYYCKNYDIILFLYSIYYALCKRRNIKRICSYKVFTVKFLEEKA